jgi:hypothetical protein
LARNDNVAANGRLLAWIQQCNEPRASVFVALHGGIVHNGKGIVAELDSSGTVYALVAQATMLLLIAVIATFVVIVVAVLW